MSPRGEISSRFAARFFAAGFFADFFVGRFAMTSRTSAHLAPLCDDLVSEMIKIKGKEATKLFCESQASAVDRIEEIQKKERIDCDFRRLDGYLFQGRDMVASFRCSGFGRD